MTHGEWYNLLKSIFKWNPMDRPTIVQLYSNTLFDSVRIHSNQPKYRTCLENITMFDVGYKHKSSKNIENIIFKMFHILTTLKYKLNTFLMAWTIFSYLYEKNTDEVFTENVFLYVSCILSTYITSDGALDGIDFLPDSDPIFEGKKMQSIIINASVIMIVHTQLKGRLVFSTILDYLRIFSNGIYPKNIQRDILYFSSMLLLQYNLNVNNKELALLIIYLVCLFHKIDFKQKDLMTTTENHRFIFINKLREYLLHDQKKNTPIYDKLLSKQVIYNGKSIPRTTYMTEIISTAAVAFIDPKKH
jgi:hypothetical protein